MAAVTGQAGLSPNLIGGMRREGVRDEEVLSAMAKVPRRAFLDEAMQVRADDDNALPIGLAQTTSQPLIIARMLEMMRAGGKKGGKVLEIGAGCGYQTALLAELCDEVYAVERIGALAAKARRNLRAQGYRGARVKHGDGMEGLPEAAPFDGIIIAAATRRIPAALVSQLAEDARLVLPLTAEDGMTRLVAVCADANGKPSIAERGELVAFVPLLSGLG
jgi:protein-L-isoaspartate(D-aspartate) O-methyltransferase